MNSTEIRQRYIDYFKKQGHTEVRSSSLIPENDPTLLFANSGMNQFKNTFLGLEKRAYTTAVTAQKCVRAGGKHNDLENVGFTARHHTFFEMLGNFSFGDYFKKEAIRFAWEFLTKDLKIPKDKLYVTVHISDDEAADIWHNQEGVPKDRIFRFDQDNFWRMGDTGPCGPSTEIFYDHGPMPGLETDPFKGIASGQDRYVEIWNLVFMQYFEKSPGVLDPLPKPSVDTGFGLERVTAAIQGKVNNYDTDLFTGMMASAEQISKIKYGADLETTSAFRVLADHSRSTAMLIADGALPSNEGRGYVLRRIMRRAIRYGRKLSTQHSMMPEVISVFIKEMSLVYPELKQREEHILTTVKEEEARFLNTLDAGTAILNEELKKLKSKNLKSIPGDILFKLYDTYGFPVDLTRVIAMEQGFTVDEALFEKEMQANRVKSKATWKGKSIEASEAHLVTLSDQYKKSPTEFVGYDNLIADAKLIALSNGTAEVKELASPNSGVVITNKTPFYAEGGGQKGDQGTITVGNATGVVHDCRKIGEVFIHFVEIESGTLKVGESIKMLVTQSVRRQTARNHSSTHLLHSALRSVLGMHITQAGSLVDAEKTRFDFTHNKALSSDEIQKVEKLVNDQISLALPVSSKQMPHKEAIQAGAMALFGEKYGDVVRVLKMGEFSTELCGGTHVSNTAEIQLFKIVSEVGVSSGVRRIEAITGEVALNYLLKHTQENLKARATAGMQESWNSFLESSNTTYDFIEKQKTEIKNLEREIKKSQGDQINVDQLAQSAFSVSTKKGTIKVVFADLGIEDRDVLAQVTDQIKNKIQSGVVVVVGKGSDSHPIIISVSKNLNPEISAGSLLKEAALVMGGKGGGRPDFAQGAAPDRTQVTKAFDKIKGMLN